MRIPIVLSAIAALAAVIVVGVAGYVLLRPPVALLSGASFDRATISPDADGVDDVATVRYSLSQPANVSIYLDSASGDRYYFRQDERRVSGDYIVWFSGVVDGYVLPGEDIAGTVERRLVPNDHYTWTIEAVSDDGDSEQTTGTLDVVGADSGLPLMTYFEINPTVFTPNQDGIHDRVAINVYLEKPASLSVYLQDATGQQYYIPERDDGRAPGDEGSHEFDYDGGVDQGMVPPPDGDYAVYAEVQDAEGQKAEFAITSFEFHLMNEN